MPVGGHRCHTQHGRFAERLNIRKARPGMPQRLSAIARHYLEVAALADDEVFVSGPARRLTFGGRADDDAADAALL